VSDEYYCFVGSPESDRDIRSIVSKTLSEHAHPKTEVFAKVRYIRFRAAEVRDTYWLIKQKQSISG